MAPDLVIRGGKVVAAAKTLERDLGLRTGRLAEPEQGLKGERTIIVPFRAQHRGDPLEPLGRRVPEMAQLEAWTTLLQS